MNDKFCSGFISLIGRPNAGKSTLMNKAIGKKIAITSDKPQTTRNRISGVLTDENSQIIFLDTPGIHKPHHKLGEQMVKIALNTLNEVDVVFYLIDVTMSYGSGEAYIIEKLKSIKTPVFLLLNKIDLLEKAEVLPLIDFYRQKMDWKEIVPLSALKGDNIEMLLDLASKYLPEGPQYYPTDAITDQPERLLIAELIREKVLEKTREEVPHSVAVEINIMEHRSEELLYIAATIFTERSSQKGILIGKKGDMLKQIGMKARWDIEKLLGNKVFLDLWVKVKADWRNKDGILRTLGYLDK